MAVVNPPDGLPSFHDLSAVMAHEIANPLHNIAAAIQLLEEHLIAKERLVDEATTDLLRLVTEEISRLVLLLDNFRSLNFFSVNLRPTSLAALVKDRLDLEAVKASRCRIRMEYDIAGNLPNILADGLKLRQVVLNLCENAIDALPDGGTVTARAYASDRKVCLDIHDTGAGIWTE